MEAAGVKKTAIIRPFCLFEFVRMPIGLRNAGQSFQRMMDQVLAGLPFAFCYIDNILVESQTTLRISRTFDRCWSGCERRAWFSTLRSAPLQSLL
jgi:hypothetical protein